MTWVGPLVGRDGAGILAVIAAGVLRIVDERDARDETSAQGIPARLFERQAGPRRYQSCVAEDLGDRGDDSADRIATLRSEQRRIGRVFRIVGCDQDAVDGIDFHLVEPGGAAGGDGLDGRVHPGPRLHVGDVEHLEGAVAVAGVNPVAVRHDAVGAGDVVVDAGRVREVNAREETSAQPRVERVVGGVDDVDTGVGSVSQEIERLNRVDPADVERGEPVAAGNLDRVLAEHVRLRQTVDLRRCRLPERRGEGCGCNVRPVQTTQGYRGKGPRERSVDAAAAARFGRRTRERHRAHRAEQYSKKFRIRRHECPPDRSHTPGSRWDHYYCAKLNFPAPSRAATPSEVN